MIHGCELKALRRKRFRTRDDMAELAKYSGMDLTIGDIRNIEQWGKSLTIREIKKLEDYLQLIGRTLSMAKNPS